jgi:exopolysaccharide biosynthesis protein
VSIDTARAGVVIPGGGVVLIAGRNAPAATRAAFMALRVDDTLSTSVALVPMHPREAVGGRPQLVRDSVILGVVDTEGQPGFATGRHPRTAAGIARNGRRLILVVVDGRQAPYSDGMTLRELATLMLGLGAHDAIDLDGGGSTTFVYSPRDSSNILRIGNRPSDPAGERTVGDALGIVRTCR